MSDEKVEQVSLTIDDQVVSVPEGTNLIEAVRIAGWEVPFYCYHRHLSVAGNCRMCQVEIVGMRKLTIACNTRAEEGMIVRTHRTSQAVADAQRATLEFLLVNHPLDCTVCDQAGHCKLQDYYYQYNSEASRFTEEKVRKVKALPLGPEVIYDGERCILCTRCVRFCEEVTKTSELVVIGRGDHSVIGIEPGRELDNELSGSVVDLCPVGALTHRRWRFNSRIWYTDAYDSLCSGCSTGCNVRVAVRDQQITQVKARLNSEVNQEWMCDQGRYGFERFQPKSRLSEPLMRQESYLHPVLLEEAIGAAAGLKGSSDEDAAVFLSPMLTLEEIWLSIEFAQKVMGIGSESSHLVMQIAARPLSEVEKVFVSPDYAPNARAFTLFGADPQNANWREVLEARYRSLIEALTRGELKRVLLVGDQAIRDQDLNRALISALLDAQTTVAITPCAALDGSEGDGEQQGLGAHQLSRIIFPGRTVNEKSGIFVNKDSRMQRLHALLTAPVGSLQDWIFLDKISRSAGIPLLPEGTFDDRSLFLQMVKQHGPFEGLSLARIGSLGLSWPEEFEEPNQPEV